MPWLLEPVPSQKRAGDRLRLYLPPDLARGGRAKQRQADEREQVMAMVERRRVEHAGGKYWLDACAGVYLTDDLGGLAEPTWPSVRERHSVQPLALLALAECEVHRVTGCDLLCDVPSGRPFRMSLSMIGGLRLWAYDAFMTGDDLRAAYVAGRRLYVPRTRPKRPQDHTLELIRLVNEMRPLPGRHPDNASWAKVLKRWNDKHPRKRQYMNAASISRAYVQAFERRRELGMLGGESAERHGEEPTDG
jgi:hypothetical protein